MSEIEETVAPEFTVRMDWDKFIKETRDGWGPYSQAPESIEEHVLNNVSDRLYEDNQRAWSTSAVKQTAERIVEEEVARSVRVEIDKILELPMQNHFIRGDSYPWEQSTLTKIVHRGVQWHVNVAVSELVSNIGRNIKWEIERMEQNGE